MKKYLTVIALLFALCSIVSGCSQGSTQTSTQASTQASTQKVINQIYVYHSTFGQRFPEYKIDLKNKKFWEFSSDNGQDYVERDKSLPNEGFTFVKDLTDEKIEIFLRESEKNVFAQWKELYNTRNVADGHQWGITITFADGSEKEISGSNTYPNTWDEMYTAFENLTGENILSVKSDWFE